MRAVAVTGCLGFIGGHLVRHLTANGYHVYGIDAETYAANLSLLELDMEYCCGDIATLKHLPDVDAVLNLAAETHVDNSISDSRRFVWSNFVGVQNLLELVRAKRQYEMPRFIQISTDEVYGSVSEGRTPETTPLNPSSPYAASKGAADLLVQAYSTTYGVPFNIIRPSNCYGTGQYREKLIPKAISYFAHGKTMPVHDTGEHRRSWLLVQDCVSAIETVIQKGEEGEIYNVGGNTEASILDVVGAIAKGFDHPSLKQEYKRAGVDHRYCVDDTKLRGLGWKPTGDLYRDLPGLVEAERGIWRW